MRTILTVVMISCALVRAAPTRGPLPLPYRGPVLVKLSRPPTQKLLKQLNRVLKGKGKRSKEATTVVIYVLARVDGVSPQMQKNLGIEYLEPIKALNMVPVLDVEEVIVPK